MSVNGSCIAQFRPRCQPPAVESNGDCLIDQKVKCKEGIFNGQDCILGEGPRCQPGTTPSGDKYVGTNPPQCKSGYKWVAGQCVNIDAEPRGDGFHEENGRCISDKKHDCPANSYFYGDKCVGGKPSCLQGTFDNGDCFSDEISQYTGSKVFRNGQCVEIHTPICDSPLVLDAVKNICVGAHGSRCPQGQVHRNGHCVLVPGQDCLEHELCPTFTVISHSLKAGA